MKSPELSEPESGDLTTKEFVKYFKNLGKKEISKILIAEINKKNPNLKLIKLFVSCKAYQSIIQSLRSTGPAANPFTTVTSAAHLAAEKGHLDVIKILEEHGVDMNNHYLIRGMPIHLAAEHGHKDIVEFLIEHGVNPGIKADGEKTPLHCAARGGQLEVMKFLLDLGVDIESQSTNGTPLHCATADNHVKAVKLLLKRGADPEAKQYGADGHGGKNLTAIEVALTRSIDISMTHEVTDDSRKIAGLIEKAIRRMVKVS